MPSPIKRVENAIEQLKKGNMIVLMDHPDRENEGDLIAPAESMSAEMMNFMIRQGTGIVCLSLLKDTIQRFNLSPMVSMEENSSLRGTPFMVSIDAKEGISTGVSASDRLQTIKTVINKFSKEEDLVKPGHIFPLQAKEGGVLERQGHTEGSIDIVKLAGFNPAAVLCEIMNPDGTMARGKQLTDFALQHKLTLLSIDDIIAYRLAHENLISEEVSATLPLEKYGEFTITCIKEKFSNDEHIVLMKQHHSSSPLVRIHSACFTGDILSSNRCDCHKQFHYSLERMSQEGGILIYLNQEGRGIGLFNKIKTYALQERGYDTVEANEQLGLPIDARQYYIAANILRNLNIRSIRLLTNNPTKIMQLQQYGIQEIEMETFPSFTHEANQLYLQTKNAKLNHVINL